jgi:hypothetical protein
MAAISRDHTRATWLTGVAGLLLLGVAVVMMVLAAPSQARPLPHHTAAQAQALAVTQAGTYPPFVVTESWLAARATPRPTAVRQ